jgi:hypothetical protein
MNRKEQALFVDDVYQLLWEPISIQQHSYHKSFLNYVSLTIEFTLMSSLVANHDLSFLSF